MSVCEREGGREGGKESDKLRHCCQQEDEAGGSKDVKVLRILHLSFESSNG